MRDKTVLLAEDNEKLNEGNLTLDIIAGIASVDGIDLWLSLKEFALLLLLARNKDTVLSAAYLYQEIWKSPLFDDKQSLKTRVSALRKKMADADCAYTIRPVYGQGYRFETI